MPARLFAAAAVALMAVGVFFRLWDLDHLPGVNGDEGWIGSRARLLFRTLDAPWTTPTGRPINIFCMLPIALLDPFVAPSFWLLRSSAALSGLAMLVLNWVLARRVFGRDLALVSTLLFAVLPVNITESRLGWENSQSVLACTVVVYLSLLMVADRARSRRWCALAAAALLAAALIHIVNVFIFPFLLAAAGVRWGSAIRDWVERQEWRKRVSLRRLGILLGGAAAAGAAAMFALPGFFAQSLLDPLRPNYALQFVVRYARLLSGVEVFRYHAGSCNPPKGVLGFPDLNLVGHDYVSWVVWAAAAAGVVLALRGRESWSDLDRTLLFGWAVGVAAFYLFGGPGALTAPFTRFSLVLVVPAGLLVARGLLGLYRFVTPRAASGLAAALLVLAAGALLAVSRDYFQFIRTTGGQGHRTFRTGPEEPKAAALRYIRSQPVSGGPVWILSSEFWLYQPIRFLLVGDPVYRCAEYLRDFKSGQDTIKSDHKLTSDEVVSAMRERRVWFVEFADAPGLRAQKLLLDQHSMRYRVVPFRDYGGRDVVVILQPLP